MAPNASLWNSRLRMHGLNTDKKMCRIIFSLVLALFSADSVLLAQQLPDHSEQMRQGTELFRDSIRQTLLSKCLRCHGGEKVRAGFDLSSRELLLKGGDSGEVIDTKNASESYLLSLIRHDDEPTMPPATDRLPEEVLRDFARWIELGAPYDKPLVEKSLERPASMQVTDSDREFWSFRPLAHVPPPELESDWPLTDSDRFVLSKMQKMQLVPNSPVDDRSRIRRAYLDVLGLPPTPEQIEAALEMPHDQLVDVLLDSPHYGERWGRHWLDAARFAESHGFEQDYDRKFAYHYRDFVIKALNSDMPWDQFVRWQIAGDEIAPNDPLAMMATGFLGAGVFPTQLTEKEFEGARYDELDDMAATVGTAMLGLTVGCARCHDHKFDPIPTSDYYRFISTFTTTIRSEVEIELEPDEHQVKLAHWQASHDKAVATRDTYIQRPDVEQRFDEWLRTEASTAVSKGEWRIINVAEAASSQNTTALSPQPDGSILATGKAPARETYTVKAIAGSMPIRFIRVEALTHESMKRTGPGRAANGNFALSNFKLFATPTNESAGERRQVELLSAEATHEQNANNLSVASAIDDDPSGTGWAIDHGGIGKDQAAVFKLESPLEFDGDVQLEFRLTFSNNKQHSLGRFRLSTSGSTDANVAVGTGMSQELADAMAALDKGELEPRHRDVLFPVYAQQESMWIELQNAVQLLASKKPQPRLVKVQVSSEGFPPTKHHADGRGFPHFYPQTHFLGRGDPNQKNGVAESGFLQVLIRNGKKSSDWQRLPPPDWTRTSYRRTALANWISDTDNGAGNLLARVIANRLWHHHFGRGIVATPNDFGLQGSRPTHPELLDFLAHRLIESGWKLKELHREILRSATWLQSKTPSLEKARIDPDNQWLWRFPERRLEAEIVRDAMLSASRKLDTKMFGPGTLDAGHQRRSIYFMIKRSRLVPMMQIFDQPEPLSSQGTRPSTTIAPQALLFMNNSEVVKWAAAFGASVDSENMDDAIGQIYLRALSRPPNADELMQSRTFVQEQAASYREIENAKLLALADLCHVVFGLNEFIYLP